MEDDPVVDKALQEVKETQNESKIISSNEFIAEKACLHRLSS